MKKIFKGIKEAHEYYKFPGSYRYGSIYLLNHGIIRSYSNGTKPDVISETKIHYVLKNETYRKRFAENMKTNTKVRFFQKVPFGVKDLGLYKVSGFNRNSVILEK